MNQIQPGTYLATATKAEFGVSKNKGSEYIRVYFATETGESISWDGYFSEKAVERTIESLRLCGCGFPSDDITNLEGLGSRQVEIVVENEEYQGKLYPRVRWVNEPGAVGIAKPLEEPAKKALRAKTKGLVAASRVAAGVKPAQPARPAAPRLRPAPVQHDAFEPDLSDDTPF